MRLVWLKAKLDVEPGEVTVPVKAEIVTPKPCISLCAVILFWKIRIKKRHMMIFLIIALWFKS